jgi:hypothetical protein
MSRVASATEASSRIVIAGLVWSGRSFAEVPPLHSSIFTAGDWLG